MIFKVTQIVYIKYVSMRRIFFCLFFPLHFFFFPVKKQYLMPPKLTAAEIEAKDAARLNQLGYKQVMILLHIYIIEHDDKLIIYITFSRN